MTPTMLFDGAPGKTVTFTASADTAYSISDITGLAVKDDNGKKAVTLLISVETYSVRIALGVDASQTLGHLRYAGESMELTGGNALNQLSFANAVAGENFVMQLTPFFVNVPTLS